MLENKIQIRSMSLSVVAVPESEKKTDPSMIIEGYALKFNVLTTLYRVDDTDVKEVILPGALDNADLSDVSLKYAHKDDNFIFARTLNKSLILTVDSVGLKIWARIIDTQQGRDLYKMVSEGLVNKMSFAFTLADGGDDVEIDTANNQIIHRIKAIDKLWDVSVVEIPAYNDTEVFARDGMANDKIANALSEC